MTKKMTTERAYWVKLKGEEKPMLVMLSDEQVQKLGSPGFINCFRLLKDESTKPVGFEGSEVSRFEEAKITEA